MISSVLLMACLASLSGGQVEGHGFFRGYRNGRTWGTGAQGKARQGAVSAGLSLPAASLFLPATEPACPYRPLSQPVLTNH